MTISQNMTQLDIVTNRLQKIKEYLAKQSEQIDTQHDKNALDKDEIDFIYYQLDEQKKELTRATADTRATPDERIDIYSTIIDTLHDINIVFSTVSLENAPKNIQNSVITLLQASKKAIKKLMQQLEKEIPIF